ncbi:hypothetical protein F4779DRAFT_98154 [Xylariaceae sp. FL0662B]|nr:hypothetical protein F4779DRAFT_98154 [Xylariaceae sp. FL0662B]
MIQPAGEGVVLLWMACIMLALCWIAVIIRVAVRRWINGFGPDDWLMCTGLILYTVTDCLVIACCYYGAGQFSENLTKPAIMQGTKLFYIAEYFYSACTIPIKASICVTILRIADARRRFVWPLYGIIGITAASTLIFMIGIANICHPITTLWGETTTGSCNLNLNSSVSFFFSAISIVTDWTLAILPGVLLWNIQMKARVKFSVSVILSLAAFASCATIVRLRYLTLYDDASEFMYSTGSIGLWSILEEGIGIIAGSMPALRPLLRLRMLGGGGLSNSDRKEPSTDAFDVAPSREHRSLKEQRTGDVKMNTFSSTTKPEAGYKKDNGDSDGDSQKHILKETQVTVTADETSTAADDWARQRVLGWNN